MKKLTQIGAYGLIKDGSKILLTTQTSGPYTGLLDLPGGNFQHGETARDCVSREIEKQGQLNISELKLFDVLTDRITWQNEAELEDLHMICILFDITAECDNLDIKNAKWFDMANLNYDLLTPVAMKAIMGQVSR